MIAAITSDKQVVAGIASQVVVAGPRRWLPPCPK
jgi:hypothetical protein